MSRTIGGQAISSWSLAFLSTCQQTLLPLGAAGNALDSDMTGDLRRMIARTHTELEALNGRLLPQP